MIERFRSLFGWREALAALAGAVVIGAAGLHAKGSIEVTGRNIAYLETEVAKLDKEVVEVAGLRGVIQEILVRKQVIEVLSTDRAAAVTLLHELAARRPAGVQLTVVRDEQDRLYVAGLAHGEAQVSAFATGLEASPLFNRVEVLEKAGGRFGLAATRRARADRK